MFELLRYITLFRTCWLGGRYGGGKTSLAVWLALELVRGRHAASICSNVPLSLADIQPVEIESDSVHDLQDVAIIMDESWLELGQGVDAKRLRSWLAFLRKNNQFILLPSVLPLARQVSHFTVERRYNLMPLGLPCWIYRWRLTSGALTKKSDEFGWFQWWRPSVAFGLYDHEYKPDDRFYVYRF